jgi:hypothetical protein
MSRHKALFSSFLLLLHLLFPFLSNAFQRGPISIAKRHQASRSVGAFENHDSDDDDEEEEEDLLTRVEKAKAKRKEEEEKEDSSLLLNMKNELKRDELAEIAAMAGVIDDQEAQRRFEEAERKRQAGVKEELARIQEASKRAAAKAEEGYEIDPDKSITRVDVLPGDVWSP